MTQTVLEVKHLTKSWTIPGRKESLRVLNKLSLRIQKAESVAIIGPSGSGKSTLLSLLAGLDYPDSGSIFLLGQNMTKLNETELAEFRGRNLGIVFQQFHLMPSLTTLENVSLPLDIAGDPDAKKKALEALDQVGLSHRLTHLPRELSGGECQRIAISRALVTKPALLLADEPSGNLDPETGKNISDLLFRLAKENSMTMLLVTHNLELAARCHRSLVMKSGTLTTGERSLQ
jgi:putative ABC transport system ATP-binding protein